MFDPIDRLVPRLLRPQADLPARAHISPRSGGERRSPEACRSTCRVAAIVGAVRAYARTYPCLLGLAIHRTRCPGAIAPQPGVRVLAAPRPLLFSRLLRRRYAFATGAVASVGSIRANTDRLFEGVPALVEL